MDEDGGIPLSYLSQYAYCPRRAGLLMLEQLWQENEYTAAGRAGHLRVHEAGVEKRGSLVKLYEHTVASREMNLSGKCDCIEAVQAEGSDSAASVLPFLSGRYRLYPIEYKHGTVRAEREYHLQLCAQAMCLEEVYGGSILEGALFFLDAHRRDAVVLSDDLRRQVRDCAGALRSMAETQRLPRAQYGPRCKKCSMLETCRPQWNGSAEDYCRTMWRQARGEEEAP